MSTRAGFWARQITVPPSAQQTGWDALCGVILPLVCLAADRIVFYDQPSLFYGVFQGSVFGSYAPVFEMFILLEAGETSFETPPQSRP